MRDLLGQRLLRHKAITEDQLKQALERQQLQGGRIGYNLIALGYLSRDELYSFIEIVPKAPGTLEDTGLELSFIADLILKHVLYMGEFKLADVVEAVKLPMVTVNDGIEMLRREKLVEVKGASEFSKASFNFSITGAGKNRAKDLLEICRYIGPAPVPLEQYRRTVELQTIRNILVDEQTVHDAFSGLIIRDSLLRRIGPAVSSGKAIFLYGPPGNGKTTIAETIGRILPGKTYVPHAIVVGGQIITVFDPVSHLPVQPGEEVMWDQRWVPVKRPVVMAGGELTLRTLDLDFNGISKFYEASLQMKANNGLFIVDDFGRQQIEPQHLLNRWIVPLERGVDFMTLHTGMKFNIPFDQIVIFATNLEPKTLVDEAFLRRIRYKIRVDHPSREEYMAIFKKVCEANGVIFKQDIIEYLLDNFYAPRHVKLNACHPRDIMDQIVDNAFYYQHAPRLTKEAIALAWENYFVEM